METQIKDPQGARSSAATAHTRSRYDLIAPFYDFFERPVERRLFRDWRGQLWDRVRGENVLELGVGTGKNIPYYPPGARVTGIDLSEKMLARARAVAAAHADKEVTLRVMDAERLDFEKDVFDETVATFVFCSVPDPVRGLREALRVTRPGGRLLLLEHMRSTQPALARTMDVLDPLVHWFTGVHIARRTVANVECAGWMVDHVEALDRRSIVRRIEAHKHNTPSST